MGGQAVLHVLRHAQQHRRAEQAGCDAHHADARLGEFARGGQHECRHTAFGGRIGRLADLAFESGDGCGHHDQPAFAARIGGKRLHAGRGEAREVERADQVHFDHLAEGVERQRPFLADDARGGRDPGAVHEHAGRAMRLGRRGDGLLGVLRRGHVAGQRQPADFGRDRARGVDIHVEDGDFGSRLGQGLGRPRPQSRAAARDDRRLSFDVHGLIPFRPRSMFLAYLNKDTRTMSSTPPKLAKQLGFAGVLPFYLGALALWTADESAHDAALAVTMIYGAVILSFVGAVHWGRALADETPEAGMGWSVTPALLGWLAAAWLEPLPGLILLIVGFWTAYVVDARAAREGRFPFWYIVLRKHLSALVVLALGLCVVAVWV